MRAAIEQQLDAIESSEDVRIVYACESGSRAWGFASIDSDYDVRFVYVRPFDWYVSIDLEDKRDVIELPIETSLDVSGWDLRKALRLLRRSNPPLLEWLGSPIVYREEGPAAAAMRDLAAEFHSPYSCAHHYLHMADGNFREYLRGAEVWRKKYFYVLRPLLAIRWIERGLGVVPTEFARLLDRCADDPALRSAIDALLEEKQGGSELDRGPRVEAISAFIESELARHGNGPLVAKNDLPPVEPFDAVFRSILDRSV